MTVAFGARLAQAMAARGPLCVGIDPHASLLTAWGLGDDVAGLERFSRTVVEALAGEVAALKPQSAFFERFGAAGIAVLERTVRDARAAETLVVLDVKRGDIGSTAAAYAEAYLSEGAPLQADCVTVSPYLGFGSLQPFVDAANAAGGGLLVLAYTSNPEGPEVQRAHAADGREVGRVMLDHLAGLNAGAEPMGSFGAVVGATATPIEGGLAELNGPLLAPGLGAQGGDAAGIAALFGDALPRVLASSSREVLSAGPDPRALRDATRRTVDTLLAGRR